ncbi:DNA-binding MarR family transcriptional regulator [Scopulibacillus darangshiensis]|uniref:DNA-binding MarR family transcriptional regulator n=1 Tax=Scopulibacillus darangshiensis TaxID=442528 RepID=A0A4R2P3N0_9BACL|nr:MarR family transcriptional regulator [Scopulibacillus darangshiensis]TCP29217.1 DNA-binding MarR family transcriptional regulator [Scopulibacillus darangshiensis]
MFERSSLMELEKVFGKVMKKMENTWQKNANRKFTRSHVRVLYILKAEGPKRASYLANHLDITSGGITGITDKLVKEGYVHRKRDENDRRVVFFSITDKGETALEEMEAFRKRFMEDFFNGLSEEDIRNLIQIYKKILANVNNGEEG